MASESIDILITADNQASPKVEEAAKSFDHITKRAKELGGQTKASTELVGTFAKSLGSTALGAFAGDMAALTERVSAFSEVAKGGTAGALAFKASLVAAAGIATYKIADSIASWWFQTEKWNRSLEQSAKNAAEVEARFERLRQKEFDISREELSLIRDPDERDAATADRASRLETQANELNAQLQRSKAELDAALARADAALTTFGKAERDQDIALAQASVDQIQKIQSELRNEADALRESISERRKNIEARKEENALADSSDKFIESLRQEVEMLKATKEERQALEAARNTVPQQRGEAEQLIRERDLLREKADAEAAVSKERESALAKEEAAKERIAQAEARELQHLEEKRIELEKGKEAAMAYRLEQEGLAKDVAADIARRQSALDEREKDKNLTPDTAPQAAVQGRLLTRGTGGDPLTQIVNLQQSANRTLQSINEGIRDWYRAAKENQKPLVKTKLVVP